VKLSPFTAKLWQVTDQPAERKPPYVKLLNNLRRTGTYGMTGDALESHIAPGAFQLFVPGILGRWISATVMAGSFVHNAPCCQTADAC
jgi:hypothetical protein